MLPFFLLFFCFKHFVLNIFWRTWERFRLCTIHSSSISTCSCTQELCGKTVWRQSRASCPWQKHKSSLCTSNAKSKMHWLVINSFATWFGLHAPVIPPPSQQGRWRQLAFQSFDTETGWRPSCVISETTDQRRSLRELSIQLSRNSALKWKSWKETIFKKRKKTS